MVKVYGTNAVEYVEDKLGFVDEFAEGDVEVRIKETKASDLRVASIKYRLKGHPVVNITSEEHRTVAKCIDELADKVGVKIAKEKDKYDSRNRKRRRKVEQEQLEAEEQLNVEELVADETLYDDSEDESWLENEEEERRDETNE